MQILKLHLKTKTREVKMVKKNDDVKVVNRENGEVKGTVHVINVRNNGTEIEVEDPDGNRSEFAYLQKFEGWKLLFPDLGDNRCINPRGSTYELQPILTQ